MVGSPKADVLQSLILIQFPYKFISYVFPHVAKSRLLAEKEYEIGLEGIQTKSNYFSGISVYSHHTTVPFAATTVKQFVLIYDTFTRNGSYSMWSQWRKIWNLKYTLLLFRFARAEMEKTAQRLLRWVVLV